MRLLLRAWFARFAWSACFAWFVGSLLLAACARAETKPAPAEPSADAGDDGGGTGAAATSGRPVEPAVTCGYPATGTSFTLPAIPGLPIGAFGSVDGTATCIDGKPFRFALRDMDGDRQPDLVVTSACGDATLGLDAWDVYTNIGTGFATTAKRFALPEPRLDPTCAKWQLADVDGDLAPDLVVTSLCTDATVGTTRWIVYKNGPAGFGTQAPFSLPVQPGNPSAVFASLDPQPADCANSQPGHAFFDVDGDRKLDLVITAACDNVQIGATAWRVYPGSGTGIATTPILFPLPTVPFAAAGTYASATGGGPGCSGDKRGPRYSVIDFDGDLRPDIVLTEDCTDTTVGFTHWSLYRNSGTGFAATPAKIALPVLPGATLHAFDALAAAPRCTGAQPSPGFATVDVDGDLRPDLLVTRACADVTTGAADWLLYENQDGGLATTGATLALPSALGPSVTAPLALGGDAGCAASPPRPAFVAMSLAQSKLDLVVTSACADVTVGTSRWVVYEPKCP